MACADIEKYLSDYIDDLVDEPIRKRVDQHLADCAECRERLESLKALVDQLGKLPRLDAPPDFMANLHARMEKGSRFKRVCKALFMPFQIKVPLELVTAAALGVLIFIMVSPMQQKQVVRRQPVKEGIMASRPAPITIALRVGPERAKPSARALSAGNQAAEMEDKTYEMRQMKAYNMSKAAAPAAGKMAAAGRQTEPVEDILQQVKHLVTRLDGRVVSVIKDTAGRPESIRIALLSDQYDQFIEQLGSLGEYLSPPPKVIIKKKQLVEMIIRFVPPS